VLPRGSVREQAKLEGCGALRRRAVLHKHPPQPRSEIEGGPLSPPPSHSSQRSPSGFSTPRGPLEAAASESPRRRAGAEAPSLDAYALSHQSTPSIRCENPKGWYRLQCVHGSICYIPLRCKKCQGCRNWKRGKNIAKVHAGLKGQTGIAFVTLTSLPGADWPFLMKRWSQLVAWLRRRMPSLQYACAKEEGPRSGMKHLHIAAINWDFLSQAQLSSQWAKYTGAPVVDVRRVDGTRVASYIAKHFAKTVPVSRKAMSFSKEWPREVHHPPTVIASYMWGLPVHLKPLAEARDGAQLELLVPGCTCFNDRFDAPAPEKQALALLRHYVKQGLWPKVEEGR